MSLLSPNARAAERQRIAARLIELGHKRQRATNCIADALVDIANCDDEADTLLGELAELSKPNPGALSGA